MQKRKILALLLVVSLMVTSLLVGCKNDEQANAGESTQEQSNNGQESNAKEGTKVVDGIEMDEEQYYVLRGAEPKSMDSAKSHIVTSWQAQGPAFEGLTRVQGSPDGDKIEPGVAESWEQNENATLYTFHLRKDAKWSDGVPVTANDFEYAIKRVADPRVASKYAWLLDDIIKNSKEVRKMNIEEYSDEEIAEALKTIGARSVDDYTLEIELAKPVPFFMQLTYFPTLYPQRKDIVEKYGDEYATEIDKMVYNGPFMLTEWVHDSKIVYEKNPNYWDKDKIYLDKIVRKAIPEQNARMQALLTGEIDAELIMSREWKAKFQSMDEFNYISRKNADVGYHIFNQNDKYFKNAKIRKAFSVAFNRDDYIDQCEDGLGFPGWEYVPDNLVIGDENYAKLVGDTAFAKKLYDEIEDSKALLIEGLQEIGEDPDPAKMEVSMMFRGTDERTKRIGEWYQHVFKTRLGVNLKLDLLKYNIAYDKFDNHEFQIFDTGWVGDFNDPSNFLDFWHSEDGFYNFEKTGWKNGEFDEIVKKAGGMFDNNERAKLYKRAEEILIYEDCVVMPYNHSETATIRRTFVKGMDAPNFGHQDYKGVYTQGRK